MLTPEMKYFLRQLVDEFVLVLEKPKDRRMSQEAKKKIQETKRKVPEGIVLEIRKDFRELGMKRGALVEKYSLGPDVITNICKGHTYSY